MCKLKIKKLNVSLAFSLKVTALKMRERDGSKT